MIPSDLHLQDSKVGCGKGGGILNMPGLISLRV